MIRSLFLMAIVALAGGCATTSADRYGYHPGESYERHGDYYYGEAPASRVYVNVGVGAGYHPYDSLFWGLRYSYFDPFWYPNFHYGVTYFPRYYHWSSWYAADYWAWRHFHPYSPWYGSYWDHYYAWRHDHVRPRRPHFGGHGDPQRYGSARNAAERMAWERGLTQRGRAAMADDARWNRGRADAAAHPRWRNEGLPSRSYAPYAERRALRAGPADVMTRDRTSVRADRGPGQRDGMPAVRRSGLGPAGDAGRSFERPAPPSRAVSPAATHGPGTMPSRGAARAFERPAAPVRPTSPAPRTAPTFRSEPRPQSSRSFDRPPVRPANRAISRGGGRGRSER